MFNVLCIYFIFVCAGSLLLRRLSLAAVGAHSEVAVPGLLSAVVSLGSEPGL